MSDITLPAPEVLTHVAEMRNLTQVLWLSVIRYKGGTTWYKGPDGATEEDLKKNLALWSGWTKVRIYKVELPVEADIDDVYQS